MAMTVIFQKRINKKKVGKIFTFSIFHRASFKLLGIKFGMPVYVKIASSLLGNPVWKKLYSIQSRI